MDQNLTLRDNQEQGGQKCSPASFPSVLSQSEIDNFIAMDHNVKLYNLYDKNDTCHSLLKAPSINFLSTNLESPAILNLGMFDVSFSMNSFWNSFANDWNRIVAPNLKGKSLIYTFGSMVRFRREGTFIEPKDDFDGGRTDLTRAIRTLGKVIIKSQESKINIFLVTDGAHTVDEVPPSEAIKKLLIPEGKTICVFVMGIGNSFPVKYSIELRSSLHNGNSNVPFLYWAKNYRDDGSKQLEYIRNIILNECQHSIEFIDVVNCSKLPGVEQDVHSKFYPGEWIYFPPSLSNLSKLRVKVADSECWLSLNPCDADVDTFELALSQFNSVLIQYKKARVQNVKFDEVFKLIEEMYVNCLNRMVNVDQCKMKLNQFRQSQNEVKRILTKTEFMSEIELAKTILKTTVLKDKYEHKALRWKGHTDEKFQRDRLAFKDVYNQCVDKIMKLNIDENDGCRIMMSSTISDLMDSNFLEKLETSNKFEFMKDFFMTGIPVFSRISDGLILNPWTTRITSIADPPYTIMSNVVMEYYAKNLRYVGVDKTVHILTSGNNVTQFNVIIPVFPKRHAPTMKHVVNTDIYAMCASNCILKNPHVIVHDAHLASLSALHVYLYYKYPTQPRSTYVQTYINDVEATANLYMSNPKNVAYMSLLKNDSSVALMACKCETIIKPLVFISLNQKGGSDRVMFSMDNLQHLAKSIVMEYIGRCLSSTDKFLLFDFFCATQNDQGINHDAQREGNSWVERKTTYLKQNVKYYARKLIEDYVTENNLQQPYKLISPLFNHPNDGLKVIKQQLTPQFKKWLKNCLKLNNIKLNLRKVMGLRRVMSAGDVSLDTIKLYFLDEFHLPVEFVRHLFSEDSLTVYLVHAFRFPVSQHRLSTEPLSLGDSLKFIRNMIDSVFNSRFSLNLFESLIYKEFEKDWCRQYFNNHSGVVKPMTQTEIVSEAQMRGINVTNESFESVYGKYRSHTGLLSNACQASECPLYLQPNLRHNQHCSIERDPYFRQLVDLPRTFPHKLHELAKRNSLINKDDEQLIQLYGTEYCKLKFFYKMF
uniref:VWFA domain-containing protein n=1 Tax=Pasiphaea japonica whispovirus TaxID=2984286 RepID=A0A9C7BXH4_9VIRU|nr:MAG: hypothetical protein [Pasiphaea japonica whispovirus]